jgi:hypothetical protein
VADTMEHKAQVRRALCCLHACCVLRVSFRFASCKLHAW